MHPDVDQFDGQLAQRRFWHATKRLSVRLFEGVQPIIAFGGLLLVIGLQIPWLQEPLEKIGFGDFGGITQTVIVTVLVSLYLELRIVNRRAERANMQTHLADPMDVYPILLQRMKGIARQDEKVLDVLGMTLYTAWPSIRFWLGRPGEMVGWKVRLAATVGEHSVGHLVPSGWFDESRQNLDQIAAQAQVEMTRGHGIRLEAYGYDFMPMLHGYRLGNGDLFYSLLQWHADGKIGRESFSYEYVPGTDQSPSAQAIRDVFDSWFRRACVRRWPWTSEVPEQRVGHPADA